jgi:beta-lactamase class A
VSFGRIAGRVPRGTNLILVTIDGQVVAKRDLTGGRKTFDFHVQLPPRDLALTVTALDDRGRRSSARVGPVFGLPRAAEPRAPPRRSKADGRLGRAIRALAQAFPGTCAIFVQDLRSGGHAAWNASVAFPAASTLKAAIALEVLRVHRGRPPRGGYVDRLLRRMLIPSEDRPANELLTWLGGSISGGSARVNSTLGALGLRNTDMYGGYEVQANEPSFVGKRTTASDFGRLLRQLHLAAGGKGLLARRFRGSFVPADARFLLYLLAHARPSWLGRSLGRDQVAIVHKPGWITRARHDGGVVYWRGGAFVAVVLTWNPRGVGASSEILAGRVARAALARFQGSSESGFAWPPRAAPVLAAPTIATCRLAGPRAGGGRRSVDAWRSRWSRRCRRR